MSKELISKSSEEPDKYIKFNKQQSDKFKERIKFSRTINIF